MSEYKKMQRRKEKETNMGHQYWVTVKQLWEESSEFFSAKVNRNNILKEWILQASN